MKPEDVATPRWHQDLSRDPRMMSALAWGIANGHTSTAQYAAKVARSMGKLPSYMLDVHFYQGLLPDACRPWRNRWEKLRDALVPESPWAARIRSQLVDPRAGSSRVGIRRRHRYDIDMFAPPMILASLGSGQTFHPPGSEGIFALLAAQDPHLATKKCNHLPYGSLQRPWYGASQTPLEVAVTYSKYLLPSAEPCILALIRAGALEPCRLRPSGNLAQSYRELLSHLLTAELKWKNRRRFLEQCWDAALEHHGGTADDEFVTSWDEGIGNALPIKPINKVAKTPQDRKNIVWELTLILEIISPLDRRSPGSAQQPNIRRYLDHCVFQRRNRYAFNYAALVGDWSHLMAP